MANGPENMPKDLQVMQNILKHAGIGDYEPSVLNQMLEFTYRYVTNIVEDAVLYSSHAKKNAVDTEDVKLAICLQQDKNFASVPTRELTAELARYKNSAPLPTIRSSAGLRMPPDRHSLTQCNFNLKPQVKKPRTVHTVSRMNVSNMAPNPVTIPRPTIVQKTAPSPIIKFSEGNKLPIPSQMSTLSTMPMPMPTTAQVSTINSLPSSQIIMPTMGIMNTEMRHTNGENKRVHEDEDYDN